jgi:hypothetical protein
LDFDADTNEFAYFSSVMPQKYAGTTGITCYIHYAMSSAEANTIDWAIAFERIGDQVLDIDGDGFADNNTVIDTTVPATSGLVDVVTIAFTNGADMDSVVAGDLFRIRVTRLATADDAAGDGELVRVELRET